MSAAAGRPRVLVDGRPLRGHLSGVGQYVWHLAAALAATAGHPETGDLEVQVLVIGDGPDGLAASPAGVGVRGAGPVPRKAFNGLAAYAPLVPASAFGLRADLVHCTYFERLPALPRGTRVVSTVHDVAFLRLPQVFSRINLAASRRALRWQVARSDVLLTPSQFTKDELVALCDVPPEKVVVTPLAVTEAVGAAEGPAGRADPRPLRERPFVLYLGNVEPRKNLARLLRAWAGSDARSSHDLVLAGTALAHAADLQAELAAAGGSVVPLGFVDAATKHELLRRCTAFVYPSLYEGFGIPVLEAMAAGAPVVTSTAGALAELTAGAALAVDPLRVDALRDAVDALVADEALRTRLGALGLSRAAGFSWERTAALTADVYRQVLGSAPVPSPRRSSSPPVVDLRDGAGRDGGRRRVER
ncbi:glycosyltransferase family 4 protein [Quadrisphaera setariae]|uniref:Glycosyltransferase family 4 protein n=1 Tax=Quadrisphaera setariae TaxID=2593304 RepID=A0A5C8ZHE7_9ACTN|nr:glycosyltransferase family 1 protein [Quadrisphaera setariae]TXR56336.1 glycosyltransferase family 4 protein [Quadrisphaera setariae]